MTALQAIGMVTRRVWQGPLDGAVEREVLSAHLAQIERVNAKVNAIVTLMSKLVLDCQSDGD